MNRNDKTKWKPVTEAAYNAVTKNFPHEWAHPVDGHFVSSIQWVNDEGQVLASAMYQKPSYPGTLNPIPDSKVIKTHYLRVGVKG